jgi:diguanylate cyclase
VARYGGEEFLVILKRVGDQASLAFERIADEWRATKPLTTFSVGVAVHESGAPSQTVARADAALYQAKAEGRDRVVLAATAISGVG